MILLSPLPIHLRLQACATIPDIKYNISVLTFCLDYISFAESGVVMSGSITIVWCGIAWIESARKLLHFPYLGIYIFIFICLSLEKLLLLFLCLSFLPLCHSLLLL
jgi:hypothetical protein